MTQKKQTTHDVVICCTEIKLASLPTEKMKSKGLVEIHHENSAAMFMALVLRVLILTCAGHQSTMAGGEWGSMRDTIDMVY